VTLLFTDVEGSTKLLHELGAPAYARVLAEHRRVLREAFSAHGGLEVDTQGDALFAAFPTARGALDAAAEALKGLAAGPIRVRMGIHTGTPHVAEEGYVGVDVHRAARIAACGHGGQLLVSASTAALLGTDRLRDLGEHRLKDFDEPVLLYQLDEGRFPPLKTISNTNLPRPASSFVGRETEVQDVASLLGDSARLLTLTGPGGSGKTRLAIEAAAELVAEFKAGVFWVGLAALRDPALVTETIAKTLGAKDGLAEHIAERELLLLLDNLEQVIEAAPELASLVEACPSLRLLVTSRERLRVRGEVEYQVLPLGDPDAVELFCARARTKPDETVHQLCRALDNLPLALELAAARASLLSPRQILDRLSGRLDLLKGGRDADPRQQTLRATIAWSHNLLTPDEQRLFARLAVFRGGCTLEAAEQVAEADLDTLQSLVDKSLLRQGEERFWMLETIREYALERLEASDDAGELGRCHAEHFLALAEEAEPHLFGQEESREWLDRLEGDHDNFRAALGHLGTHGESQLGLRVAAALWVFWRDRGHFTEGRRRLETALRADERPTAERAKALNAAAMMAALGGDAATGRLWAEEALALHRRLGDEHGIAESESWLGWALGMADDWTAAQRHFEESVQRFRALGDEHSTVMATHMLAWAYSELGERERARTLDEENLRRARELHSDQVVATTLDKLASYAIDEGRADDAVSLATESLRVYRDAGDSMGAAIELCRCAHAIASTGRGATTAARLLSGSEVLQEEGIGGTMPWVARIKEETLPLLRKQLDEAAFAEAWEQGRALTVDEAVALALSALERDA
jgi:predicted ATPase